MREARRKASGKGAAQYPENMFNPRKSVLFALIAALVLSTISVAANPVLDSPKKITLEDARKIALKKVEGTIEDEFSIEDDEGNVTDYIFYITDKKGKTWEVQIGAEKGDIVSAEMQEDEDPEDPPADEDPPALR